MKFGYVEQSLQNKPWVKGVAVLDPATMQSVYSWGGCSQLAGHAKCMMEPSSLVSRVGAWTIGAFYHDGVGDTHVAFLRNVRGFALLVEGELAGEHGYQHKKKGAKSIANAAKRDLRLFGLYESGC